MKKTILTICGKLLLGCAVSISILGIGQAKTVNAQEFANQREKIGETLRRQHWKPEKSEKSVSVKNLSSGGLSITKVNQDSFDIGQRFALAVANTTDLGTSEQAYQYMLVDLVELIDKFEGKPEAFQLQKILKSVIRKTANGKQIKTNLEAIAKTYQTKQTKQQQWYFNSGSTVIKLIFASYFGDDADLKKRLSEMQSLIKIAPTGTPKEMIQPMGNLVKYVAQATFSESDYLAIYKGAAGITQLVIA